MNSTDRGSGHDPQPYRARDQIALFPRERNYS
jgi:hypothetical protein